MTGDGGKTLRSRLKDMSKQNVPWAVIVSLLHAREATLCIERLAR